MLISSHCTPEQFVIEGDERPYGENSRALCEGEFLHQMMYLDLTHYLPDDILTKTDRASMYSSLELRAPLLDHRVVEYAWQMRFDMAADGPSKAPLRNLLYQHVPKELIERPKSGFAVPLAIWLRGPLRSWAEQYMNKTVLSQGALLNADRIVSSWNRFQQGEPGGEHFLWNVLMFALWSKHYSSLE